MVRVVGIEPTTSWFPTKHATTALHPDVAGENGASTGLLYVSGYSTCLYHGGVDGGRTHDLLNAIQALIPTELLPQVAGSVLDATQSQPPWLVLVPLVGLEPTSVSL